MKILLIGANGTIGKRLKEHLDRKHEIIAVGRNSGTITADIANPDAIQKMYQKVGKVDAVVCAAGEAKWDAFTSLSEADFYIGIKSKLMGQVNLVRIGLDYINPKGSFTLTTGILGDDPVNYTTSAAMVNGGINSFVKAAALEMENGIRINVVSPGLVEDAAEKYEAYFPGHTPVSMQKTVDGYIKSIEGRINGQVIRVLA